MREPLRTIWNFARAWSGRIAGIVVALCLLLEFFGLPIADKFIPGLTALLLVGIYEIILESKYTNEKAGDELSGLTRRIQVLEESAASLVQQLSPKLYALFECKQELEGILERAQFGDKVVIDHLGLDMHQAWEYVHGLLFGATSKLTDIDYRLLILSAEKRDDWPAEVQDWSASVPGSLRRIQADLTKVIERFQKAGKRCKIEIRQYAAVPIVHGWSVRQPIKTWHVAFCRWNECQYDWSEHHYVKVDQFTRTPVVGDIADVFDSYFDRFWTTSLEKSHLKFETAASQQA